MVCVLCVCECGVCASVYRLASGVSLPCRALIWIFHFWRLQMNASISACLGLLRGNVILPPLPPLQLPHNVIAPSTCCNDLFSFRCCAIILFTQFTCAPPLLSLSLFLPVCLSACAGLIITWQGKDPGLIATQLPVGAAAVAGCFRLPLVNNSYKHRHTQLYTA